MDSWLSILGSIASIGGAIYAYRQAIKSRNYATEAQQLRDEFVNRRQLVEVSQVHAETNRILKVVSKAGPTCTSTSIKGINVAGIAQEVEEYSRFLNAQSAYFSELFSNRASELCVSLNDDIEALAEALEFEDIKLAGKRIYYKINEFLPVVKSLTDDKKEQKSTFQR
jgi:hypothetical protein